MNSVFVYCEIEEGTVADVSLELLTKGRALATKLGVKLEAIALGEGLKDIEKQVFPYGVDVLWVVMMLAWLLTRRYLTRRCWYVCLTPRNHRWL